MPRSLVAACLLALAPALTFGAPVEMSGPAVTEPAAGAPSAAALAAPAALGQPVRLDVGAVLLAPVPASATDLDQRAGAAQAASYPHYSQMRVMWITPAAPAAAAPASARAEKAAEAERASLLVSDPSVAFDGRAATSDDVLSRLPDAPRARDTLAAAIAGARGVDGALDGVERLGALSRGERSPLETDRLFLARRLWDRTSEGLLKRAFGLDRSWSVPAIVVRRPDATFYVHPVAHGRVLPLGRKAVVALAREIEERGQALYSEQNLPLHYGYAFGKELLDHAADEGRAVAVVPAAGGLSAARVEAAHAFSRLVLATLALGAASVLFHLPLYAALPGLAALAFVSWLLASGLTPLERRRLRRWARQAERDGGPGADYAAQWRREAAALYTSPIDPLEALRLHLPPGPGAAHDPNAVRSQAMADAVAADAAAAGAKDVHLLAGHAHAAHVAWRLREGA